MPDETPNDALEAARRAWRERVEAERQRDRQRQGEEAVREAPAPRPRATPPAASDGGARTILANQEVIVPWPSDEDGVTVQEHAAFAGALVEKGFSYDHPLFAETEGGRKRMVGAIYKRKIHRRRIALDA